MTEVFSVILGRDRDENDETGGSDNSEERRVWVCVRGSLKDCLGCHCEAQRRTCEICITGEVWEIHNHVPQFCEGGTS